MKRKFSSTGRGLHIDMLITNMLIGYTPQGSIGRDLFPIVPVGKQSDHYPIFSRAEALTLENAKRSPGKEANMIDRNVSSATYFCDNYALKMPVTIEDKANADPIFAQKLIAGQGKYIIDKLSLVEEDRIAALVTNPSNVGSSSAVTSAWTDIANSDPVTDIWTMFDNIQDSTGYRPNSLALSDIAWRNLRRNDVLNNQILGNNNGQRNATRQQIADFFEVERFLIGGMYKNTGNEAQAEVLERMWGDHVLAYYAPMTPSTNDEPSFGYHFRWSAPGLPNMQVERHPYDSKTKSEEVEVGYYQDEKVTGADYGFLLTNTTSST